MLCCFGRTVAQYNFLNVAQYNSTGVSNMSHKTGISININCATTTDTETSDFAVQNGSSQRSRRPWRGNGWSQRGTKKQRKTAREKKSRGNFAFYAVFKGWTSDVIYDNWPECEACVKTFSGPVYKGFHCRVGAVDWLREKRTRTVFDSMMQERERTQANSAETCDANGREHTIPIIKAIPVPEAIPTATAVHVPAPPAACARDFSPVAELARLIANAPVKGLSPPPKCTNIACPYTCGEVRRMQKILLQRLYQTTILTSQHNDVGKEHKL